MIMNRIILARFLVAMFLELCFGMLSNSYGQANLTIGNENAARLEKAGDRSMAEKDFYSAMMRYQEASEKRPNQFDLKYKLAESARAFSAFEEAERAYEDILKSDFKDQFPDVKYRLAQVSLSLGKYDRSANLLDQYLKDQPNGIFRAQAEVLMQQASWAAEQLSDPGKEVITSLGKRTNSEFSDFGALAHNGALYFTSYRYKKKEDNHSPQRKLSKVLMAKGTGRGRPISRNFNSDERHTAHTTISPDNKFLYYNVCEFYNATQIRCKIYRRQKNSRNTWVKPVELPEAVNMPGFTHTQPSIGYDSSANELRLYFASDRPGGQGGLDIWYVPVFGKDKYGTLTNLKEVNTAADEATPFYDQAGQKLYFASMGQIGFGGYDVYRLGQNSEIENLGTPINTSYDDLYFSILPDSTKAYLSSNRPGAKYLDQANKACCLDIYEVLIPEPEQVFT